MKEALISSENYENQQNQLALQALNNQPFAFSNSNFKQSNSIFKTTILADGTQKIIPSINKGMKIFHIYKDTSNMNTLNNSKHPNNNYYHTNGNNFDYNQYKHLDLLNSQYLNNSYNHISTQYVIPNNDLEPGNMIDSHYYDNLNYKGRENVEVIENEEEDYNEEIEYEENFNMDSQILILNSHQLQSHSNLYKFDDEAEYEPAEIKQEETHGEYPNYNRY